MNNQSKHYLSYKVRIKYASVSKAITSKEIVFHCLVAEGKKMNDGKMFILAI